MITGLDISMSHVAYNGLEGMVVLRRLSPGQASDEYAACAAWLDEQ